MRYKISSVAREARAAQDRFWEIDDTSIRWWQFARRRDRRDRVTEAIIDTLIEVGVQFYNIENTHQNK